jgi:hypothetical protein
VDRPRLITADHFCIAGDAETYEMFGITIKVASLHAVIRPKQAAGRDVDLQALPTLHGLRERKGG